MVLGRLRNGIRPRGVRLTHGVCEAPGPLGSDSGEENGTGRFGEMGWAGSAVETGQRAEENGP
jgi:hypothetical protein